jgi:hypothetical protein
MCQLSTFICLVGRGKTKTQCIGGQNTCKDLAGNCARIQRNLLDLGKGEGERRPHIPRFTLLHKARLKAHVPVQKHVIEGRGTLHPPTSPTPMLNVMHNKKAWLSISLYSRSLVL